jgi:hypothetical protein
MPTTTASPARAEEIQLLSKVQRARLVVSLIRSLEADGYAITVLRELGIGLRFRRRDMLDAL